MRGIAAGMYWPQFLAGGGYPISSLLLSLDRTCVATSVAHSVDTVPAVAVRHTAAWPLVLVVPSIGVAAVIALPSAESWSMMTGFLPIPTVMLFVAVLAAGGAVFYQSLTTKTFQVRESMAFVACAGVMAGGIMLLQQQLFGPFASYNAGRLVFVMYTGAAACALTAASVRNQVQRILLRVRPEAIVAFLVVFGLGLLSAALSENVLYALMDVSLYMGLALTVLLVAAASIAQQERTQKLLLWGFVAGTALYLLTWGYSWLQHAVNGRMIVWPDINLGFSNIRIFNHVQTWTLPLLVLSLLLLPKKHVIAKAALFFLCCGWWMLLFTSGGRGTVFGLLIASLAVAVLFQKDTKRWLGLQVSAAAVGGILYAVLYYATAARSLLHRSPTSDSGRFEYWAFALEQIQSAPVLGVGPMHYAVYPDSMGGSPHNAVLQFAAEWGLIAATLLIIVVAWALVAWVRQSIEVVRTDGGGQRSQVRVALTAVLIAALAHTMVSGLVVAPLSQLLLVLVVGWALGLYVLTKQSEEDQASSVPEHRAPGVLSTALIAATVLCSIFLVGSTVSEATHVMEQQQHFVEQADNPKLHPRFWQQGFIIVNEKN